MSYEELIGQVFTLDNGKNYIVISTYYIENYLYALLLNEQNEKDVMFAKIITSDSDLFIEELNDFSIIQKIFEIIKNKNLEN